MSAPVRPEVKTWVEGCASAIVLVEPSPATAIAAAEAAQTGAPRVYVLSTRIESLTDIFRELAVRNLARAATMFHGTAEEFAREVAIVPGLLILEGAPIATETLLDWLAPGTPVVALTEHLCEVGAALEEEGALQEASASAKENRPAQSPFIYRATAACRGHAAVPTESERVILQGRQHEALFATNPSADGPLPRGTSGRGGWPYFVPSTALPPTLPSGKPWPKISIVTPTYNQGAYIEETLLSVIHQHYPNLEHIVMDGGSTDATLAVLERYRDRLTHYRSEPDNGQSHAINKGMALATGDILTWLNSDDMLAPGALAAVALAFDTHPADMVAGICRLYRDGELMAQHITSCADGPLPLQDLLDLDGGWNAGQFFYQPEVMFTRDLWQRAGGYVHDWLHYSMDYEMWLRFAEAGARLHVIGRPVAWFRLHPAQKTHITARFQAELVVCRRGFLRQRGMEFTPPVRTGLPNQLRNQLRITMLNDIGPFYGAGIAHVRMARALAWAGHELSLVSILDRSLTGIESTHYTNADVLNRVVETRPDLVIVGNLHAAGADAFLLQELCERFPVSIVMHDFWSITGRCPYPGTCEKYLGGCNETCPTADEYPVVAPPLIAGEWRKKRLILGAAQGPTLLANSQWAAELADHALAADAENVVRQAQVVPFHLSFPLDVFHPRDPMLCREILGLPADKFIVLLPGGVRDPRKGAMEFLRSLGRLALPDLLVVTLGLGDPDLTFPVPVLQLGQFQGQRKMAMVLSAADLVVAPSGEETFGQTVVEAIACGTPALAYAVSGSREAIRHGVTGILTDADPDSLAAAVRQLYANPQSRRDIAHWGRLYVENEWSEFAASQRLYLALRAIDADGRLGLGRNIRLSGQPPALPPFQAVAKCDAGWRPIQGISQMEYPLPEYGLGPFRWAYGPGAVIELFAAESGLHRVLFAYRNIQAGQQIALRCNGTDCGVFELPAAGFGTGRVLVANVPLEKGANLLQLRFSVWDTTREDLRPLAIILTDVAVEPVAMCDHLARQTTTAQMLASVWGGEPLTQ